MRTRRATDDVPLAIGPLLGWRAWSLSGRGGDVRLLPTWGPGKPWPPLRPAVAKCLKHRRHLPPVLECTCGLYGTRGPKLLQRTRSPVVVGTVAMWGLVIEHTLGHRAEFAYPQRLQLVCPVCLFQRGIHDAETPVIVAVLTGARLLPLCGEHHDTASAVGLPVRASRPVDDVRDALLDTYGVETLDVPRLEHSMSGSE